jgi:hypothetical protein
MHNIAELEEKGSRKTHLAMTDGHLTIVVAEGKVTLENLHTALDQAIKQLVKGGCNCGLTGFDISFLRGDPERAALSELTKIPNIQGAVLTQNIKSAA